VSVLTVMWSFMASASRQPPLSRTRSLPAPQYINCQIPQVHGPTLACSDSFQILVEISCRRDEPNGGLTIALTQSAKLLSEDVLQTQIAQILEILLDHQTQLNQAAAEREVWPGPSETDAQRGAFWHREAGLCRPLISDCELADDPAERQRPANWP